MARSKGVVVQISAEDNSARAFESVQAQVTRLREQVATLRAQLAGGGNPGEMLAGGMGHAVPEIAAASGAIREMEGTLPIRAVERFLTTTLGLGPALAAAFPVVGAIAFAGVIYDGVKKLDEMHESAQNAGKAMHDAFAQAEAEARLANDALRVSNDRLQDTLDKLEHKPENGAALALDQVAEAADKAAAEIQKDIDKMDELMKKNEVSFFGRLENKAGTKDDAKEITGFNDRIKKTTSDYQYDIDRAADRGEKGNVDKLRIDQAVALQKVYAEATQNVTAALREAENAQYDYENKHVGSDQTSRIEQMRGALQLWQEQQQRIGGGLRATDLQSKIDPLQAKKGNDDAARKAEEAAQKLREAQQKGSDAAVKLAEQGAQAGANAQKRVADLELAALDAKHKQALISDREFYAERARIQTGALAAEAAAIGDKSQDVQAQLTGAIQQRGKDSGNPLKQAGDDTRIIELQTQLGKLNEDRLKVEEQIQKLKQDGAALDTEAADKALDASQKLAARLEAVRGGGTAARTAQSDTQYARRREEMVAQNAPAQDLTNEDALHGIETASIKVKGAEQASAPQVAGIQTQRTGVDDEVRRGQMSTVQAQQEKIALDREEADALQPVLAAYRELAAQGDIAASEKVAQLAQRITELRDPVNETAAEIRNQFDGAFETLFENLDKGQKAWQDFAKSLQKDVLKDTYKQFVQPAVQMGMGMLVPNGGRDNLSAPGNQAASSAIGGLLPKLMPSLARPTFPGGTAAAQPVVNIINNSSQPVQGSASSQQGDLTDMIRPSVIQVVLENMQTGGSIGQALAGVGMGLLA